MSTVFGIHTPQILTYNRSRSSSRDAPNCQGNEAGARERIGLFIAFASGSLPMARATRQNESLFFHASSSA
jgi:hypothetical protein